MRLHLESVLSVPLSTRDTIVGVVVARGSDVHAVVGLDVSTSGIVARDAALGLLLLSPRGMVATDAVDGVDQNLGRLLHVLRGVVRSLWRVVTPIDLHQPLT